MFDPQKMIGKTVTITNPSSLYNGKQGIITGFAVDGGAIIELSVFNKLYFNKEEFRIDNV